MGIKPDEPTPPKASNICKMFLTTVDVVALIGLSIYVAKYALWPLLRLADLAINDHEVGAYPVPMIYLCLLGLPWLIRRHIRSMASFLLVLLSPGAEDEAALPTSIRWLFVLLDIASSFAVTVVVGAGAWIVLGYPLHFFPANTREPVELLLGSAFMLPAAVGGAWLIRGFLVTTSYLKKLEELARKGPPSSMSGRSSK